MKYILIFLPFLFFGGVVYASFYSELQNRATKLQDEAVQLCEGKWTKRGVLNQKMSDYCFKKQGKALKSFGQKIREWADKDWLEELINLCGEKWTKRGITDFSMLDYCMNKQHEGILDIEYWLKENPNSKSVFDICKSKWKVDRGMIAYCLKKDD